MGVHIFVYIPKQKKKAGTIIQLFKNDRKVLGSSLEVLLFLLKHKKQYQFHNSILTFGDP